MIVGLTCFIGVFIVLINKVSPQLTVEGVIGCSVVLPCSSTEHDLKIQDINVHWRHNNSKIVYDVVGGKDTLQLQDQWYNNRVSSFPDEYLRGNLSIKLNDLNHTDAGKYSCFIPHSSEEPTVQLIINESKAENRCKSTDPEAEAGANRTSPLLIVVYVVLALAIPAAIFIIFFGKKITQAAFSSIRTKDTVNI